MTNRNNPRPSDARRLHRDDDCPECDGKGMKEYADGESGPNADDITLCHVCHPYAPGSGARGYCRTHSKTIGACARERRSAQIDAATLAHIKRATS